MIKNLILLLLLGAPLLIAAQLPSNVSLFNEIKSRDSLLFDIGFNTCDVRQFEQLLSDDFEFYHDKSGPVLSKTGFVDGIRDGLCTNPYHPVRKLVPGSMTVYPLYNSDTLYGAVQVAKHRFYERMEDGTLAFRSVARFDHLWILENGQWKLKRSLSYDHLTVEGSKDGPDQGRRNCTTSD